MFKIIDLTRAIFFIATTLNVNPNLNKNEKALERE
jgi:hypothetical protein